MAIQQKALDDQLARARTEVEKLQKVLAEGTQLLARNSADVGAQVQQIQATVDQLTGQLDEARHELEALRKELGEFRAQTDAKIAELAAGTVKALPEGQDALFAEADKQFKAKNYEEARRALRQFLNHHGSDPRADNARFMIGQAYFQEGRYAAAIGEYQKVIDGHPKGDVVADAFLRNGVAFFKLKSCTEARVFLQELIRRFPGSALVKKARETLEEIDKVRKNKTKCSS
jgi:tol-pal system protein YbgF